MKTIPCKKKRKFQNTIYKKNAFKKSVKTGKRKQQLLRAVVMKFISIHKMPQVKTKIRLLMEWNSILTYLLRTPFK